MRTEIQELKDNCWRCGSTHAKVTFHDGTVVVTGISCANCEVDLLIEECDWSDDECPECEYIKTCTKSEPSSLLGTWPKQ